ncbi:MAG TPA: EamA family transporter [Desulfobulbaceae bacterium]|nr:EamA family transporter [Desulfobulbaceae bacterium]
MISERLGGALFIAGSAIGFGAMAIFGKIAFGSGASTATVLFFRFLAAGTLMVMLMVSMRQQWPKGRDLAVLILMGGLGYAGQAFCFFSALHHATAGLTGLLLYLFPALVIVGSAILGRRKLTWSKVLLALLALIGILLTVAGGLAGTPTGIAFGVGAALIYTVYILVGEGVTGRTGAVSAGCVIMLSAAVVFGVVMTVEGPTYPGTPAGWLAVAAIAVVSTLMPIVFFFAGMRRLGAGDASTLSTLEPVVTLFLAYVFLGEKLGPVQAAGAGLVIAAVVILTRLR